MQPKPKPNPKPNPNPNPTPNQVQPKLRQMLFFGYKLNGEEGEEPRMDHGLTEHTGCPLREGRKWIATMWYREGMTAEKGWEAYRM